MVRTASPFKRIIYCGDGANDLCPCLALLPSDHVLARKVSPACPPMPLLLLIATAQTQSHIHLDPFARMREPEHRFASTSGALSFVVTWMHGLRVC